MHAQAQEPPVPQVTCCRGGASDPRVGGDEWQRGACKAVGAVGVAGVVEQLEDRPSAKGGKIRSKGD
jgi:hypothetical protein